MEIDRFAFFVDVHEPRAFAYTRGRLFEQSDFQMETNDVWINCESRVSGLWSFLKPWLTRASYTPVHYFPILRELRARRKG